MYERLERFVTTVEGNTNKAFKDVPGRSSAPVAGVDVGATSVGVVAFADDGSVRTAWRRHNGHPVRVVRETLDELRVATGARIGVMGAGAGRLTAQGVGTQVDEVRAIITVARRRFPEARNILDIGGGSLSRLTLDDEGSLLEYATNTLCAAGTGSFLDEQARRMGQDLDDPHGWESVDDPPAIATRCAVFAKSDLIHRQQEGYSRPEMWSGLCRGLTGTILTTLFKGKPVDGPTAVVGGVSQNGEVIRWLKARLPEGVLTYPGAPLTAAAGAAWIAERELEPTETPWDALEEGETTTEEEPRRPALRLKRSTYPSFDVREMYVDDEENEVRVHQEPASLAPNSHTEPGGIPVWLGIDVGSTSTKLVLLDEGGEVLVDVYRKTGGDPIGATKALFRALSARFPSAGENGLRVLGCATTGSGRKLVGTVLGADLIQNEITAHVTGAMAVDPSIDTIFEIGGQDAKYMDCRGGHCRDAAMNYVCAAGTGSFVEEQANRLGFHVSEVGDATIGLTPPMTSDRCTVFMEQDVDVLVRRGFSQREAMAAVLYSVVRNYLTKVVGTRYYSRDKVFFQGATARNKGLVAAFENLLGVEVVVSSLCHVMGAYGVARLIRDRAAEQECGSTPFATDFVGLDFASREVRLEEGVCELCENRCAITTAQVEGQDEAPSWGYLCGREPDEDIVKKSPGFKAFQERQRKWRRLSRMPRSPRGRVGIPRAMSSFGYLPLFQTLVAELGYTPVLSRKSDEPIVNEGAAAAAADYCFPIKLAHGHLFALEALGDQPEDEKGTKGVDFVLAPIFLSEENDLKQTIASNFCPLNTGLSAMYRAALALRRGDPERVLRPCFDLRWSEKRQVQALEEAFGEALGVSRWLLRGAWRKARAAQRRFDEERQEIGRRALARAKDSGRPAIVVLGRPYNLYDERANVGLPRKIADYGYDVIPLDCLPIDRAELPEEFHNVFWRLGQDMLLAAKLIARTPHLYGVTLTNFACGPDSFLLTFLQEVMGEKPFLILELDEHGADAGYLTRVEAFLDVIVRDETAPSSHSIRRPDESPSVFRDRTIWLPNMHPTAAVLMASAMRAVGFDARVLPPETREDFERGRAVTRGTECLPAPCTLGTFLGVMEREGLDPKQQALFMPKAAGPCRFGQYALLDRVVLNRMGLGDVTVMSPISENAYEDIGGKTVTRWLWRAVLTGDAIFKLGCRLRPYERQPGQVDAILAEAMPAFQARFEARLDPLPTLLDLVERLKQVPLDPNPKPLVGIVGEIYVRSNPFANQDLIGAIERAGGEAWLVPVTEWIRYLGLREKMMAREAALEKPMRLGELLGSAAKHEYLGAEERVWNAAVAHFLADRTEPDIRETVRAGEPWIPVDFEGETVLTIGRCIEFAQQGVSMVVNVSPFGCMVGSLSSAVLQRVQEETGIPIINLFYDGDGDLNHVLKVYLANATERLRTTKQAAPALPLRSADLKAPDSLQAGRARRSVSGQEGA